MRTAEARGCHYSQVEHIRDAQHLKSLPNGSTLVMCPGFLRDDAASEMVKIARDRKHYVIPSDKFNPVQRRA